MSNRIRSSVVAAIAVALVSAAQAAGVQFIEVPAEGSRQALTGAVWYPCIAPPQEVRLRGLRAPGVKDCPVAGAELPLVVISHGRNGWYGGHHDTAEVLADGGFVVAAINHPDENAISEGIVNELSVAANRPGDSKRLIDFMLGAWSGSSHIDGSRIGHFGFSRGGYTTLAVIGGTPNYRRKAGQCRPEWNKGQCDLFRKYETIPERRSTLDSRIKAAVIADPAWTIFFGEQDLSGIRIPVQLWSSELGGAGVSVQSVANVRRRLPPGTDYRLVPKAGHFSFLAPCSQGQSQNSLNICVDAPDFDRVAFHKEFNAAVLGFFRTHLVETQEP